MSADTEKPSTPGGIILRWWAEHLGARTTGAQKALAARLRRATDVETLCEPDVQLLAQALRTRDVERLVRLARVLAELRGTDSLPLAFRFGAGEKPLLSHARFQRLMRADGEELVIGLVRAIRMLPSSARSCNIARLGDDLYFWNDRTRMRWAFEYFHQTAPETGKTSLLETNP